MDDGTYIESGFKDGKPHGQILIIRPNGTYFEGKFGGKDGLKGIFRNPVLKRQSLLQKDPGRSKRMNYGRNVFGYAYLQESRYKGLLGGGKASV